MYTYIFINIMEYPCNISDITLPSNGCLPNTAGLYLSQSSPVSWEPARPRPAGEMGKQNEKP
jgi:hypothetical protein